MRKIVTTMHMSADGFVGGPSGEMDWIHVDNEIFEYAGRNTDAADTALYGRNTYNMMNGYWPTAGEQPNASVHDKQHSTWYNSAHKVIISNSMKGNEIPNTKIIGGDSLKDDIMQLKQQPGRNIQIFGSPGASHALMQHDLIDEYWLFVNPVLLGDGIPMFKNIKDRVRLKLVETHAFASGVVMLHYEKK